jgi:hypothetical protein
MDLWVLRENGTQNVGKGKASGERDCVFKKEDKCGGSERQQIRKVFE